ncbi:MAG: DUF433 domain-containing protein [Cyanobacteria bacterium J06649_4]
MNTQLVDSLVQVIESLSAEESTLLLSKLQDKPIRKTPGVCGGNARIHNTRIPVWTLVSLRQQGADSAELLRNYPSLSQADLDAAWAYYRDWSEEIDTEIAHTSNDLK